MKMVYGWTNSVPKDFRRRFIALLSYKFREFAPVTALTVLEGANSADGSSAEDSSRRMYPNAFNCSFAYRAKCLISQFSINCNGVKHAHDTI